MGSRLIFLAATQQSMMDLTLSSFFTLLAHPLYWKQYLTSANPSAITPFLFFPPRTLSPIINFLSIAHTPRTHTMRCPSLTQQHKSSFFTPGTAPFSSFASTTGHHTHHAPRFTLLTTASSNIDSAKAVLEKASQDVRDFDPRAFRRSLNQTGRYTRKPSNDPNSLELMEEHGVGYSTAGLVAQMREQGYVWKQGNVTVKLAEAYGFCWGVERAVQMAYEARKAYPTQRLHITNEIIHNPGVNQRLKEMDVQFIDAGPQGE